MYAIAVRQADGRIKVEMGDDIHLDPVNGGFVSLKRFGSSVGFPISQIECVVNSSQFDMLTENQVKAIALGQASKFVRDWEARAVREWERRGEVEPNYNAEQSRLISKVLNDLLDSLRPQSDRPTLEARLSGNH